MTIDTIIGILKGRIDLYVDLGKGGKIQRHDILPYIPIILCLQYFLSLALDKSHTKMSLYSFI